MLSEGKILVDSTPGELMRQAPGHNRITVRFGGEVPGDLVEQVASADWASDVSQNGSDELRVDPADGRNCVAEVLELVRDHDVVDVRLHEGRLDDLFRKITKGVAA